MYYTVVPKGDTMHIIKCCVENTRGKHADEKKYVNI